MSATSVLPFKFQELELVGAFPDCSFGCTFVPHLLPKIQTWKMPQSCQKWGQLNFEPFAAGPCTLKNTKLKRTVDYIEDVYQNVARKLGGIMSGIPSHPSQFSSTSDTDTSSTGDEVPTNASAFVVHTDIFDPPNAPYATVKVFYRPRGGSFVPFPATNLILCRTVDGSRSDCRIRCRRIRGQRQEAC
jgi:hypothetical protein